MKEAAGDANHSRAEPGLFSKAHGLFSQSRDEPVLPRYRDQPDDPCGPQLNCGDVTASTTKTSSRAPRAIDEKELAGAAVTNTRSAASQEPKPSADDSRSTPPEGSPAHGPKPNLVQRFLRNVRNVLLHSWVNLLLVFVPVGIIVEYVPGIHGGVVFAINCIAIVPLAGLLSHATESVAVKLGDTVGALLNVTFGNAVELIIFIIALTKGQIRIVQASLLGSILSNLLLILGMCFFLGGLRFREQIYNATVTQMSACLLSLSVISLVLPTAFHASFRNQELADSESLKISRICSIVLLIVYLIYLLFQLKSHAYMYESTPQHIVDAQSTPGPAAAWLDTSSSDDSSSSSSSSSSDDSDGSSHTVRKKMKKVLRRARRSSSGSSLSGSEGTANGKKAAADGEAFEGSSSKRAKAKSADGNESYDDDEAPRRRKRHIGRKKNHRHNKHHKRHAAHGEEAGNDAGDTSNEATPAIVLDEAPDRDIRRVDFANQDEEVPPRRASEGGNPSTSNAADPPRRPFVLRGVSVKNVRNLAPVFAQNPEPGELSPGPVPGRVPRVRYGIRRTNSLPDRLNQPYPLPHRAPGALFPPHVPLMALTGGNAAEPHQHEEFPHDRLSTPAAVILLLISTGLVALCAEFVVDSIEEVVQADGLREAFIGLIILPVVGNAAEHVTAITVAMKNKMDLAIGVAVGSSIQIALFVTPLVVILGWILDKDMTLYFTLFETVCLFVSAFIVNFLVLDGRSNYLEGALLMCTYAIIGVVAFYYPNVGDAVNE